MEMTGKISTGRQKKVGKKENSMKNIGTADRVIRVVIAAALFSLLLLLQGNLKWLGLIPLITAIVGVCPLYSLLHISTKRK